MLTSCLASAGVDRRAHPEISCTNVCFFFIFLIHILIDIVNVLFLNWTTKVSGAWCEEARAQGFYIEEVSSLC